MSSCAMEPSKTLGTPVLTLSATLPINQLSDLELPKGLK